MTRMIGKPWFAIALLSATLAAVSSCNSGYGGGSSYPTGPGTGPGTTAKELNSPDFGQGGTFEHTFATAGTYPYHCIHHAPMTGTVQVTPNAADMVVNVSITSSSMAFPAASVKPGGRVIWTNNTPTVHTVTSN